MSSGPSKIVMCHYQWSPDKRFLERRGERRRSYIWTYRYDDRSAIPMDPQLQLYWFLDPSVSGDSTLHASFMMSSYHETEEMTAAEVAETLETLVRWSD